MAQLGTFDFIMLTAGAVYSSVGIVTIITNCFCVYAIIKCRMLEKSSAYTLLSLVCVMDIFTGLAEFISGVTFILPYTTGLIISQLTCYLININWYIVATFPCFLFLLVAVERLYLIAWPLHYRSFGRKNIMALLIVAVLINFPIFCWSFVGISAVDVLPYCAASTAPNQNYLIQGCLYGRVIPLALCCVSYAGVVIMYRKRKAAIADSVGTEQASEDQRKQREITRMVLSICIVYVITNVGAWVGASYIGPAFAESAPLFSFIILQIFGLFSMVSPLLNPLLIPLKNLEVRAAMKKSWKYLASWGRIALMQPNQLASTTARGSQASNPSWHGVVVTRHGDATFNTSSQQEAPSQQI